MDGVSSQFTYKNLPSPRWDVFKKIPTSNGARVHCTENIWPRSQWPRVLGWMWLMPTEPPSPQMCYHAKFGCYTSDSISITGGIQNSVPSRAPVSLPVLRSVIVSNLVALKSKVRGGGGQKFVPKSPSNWRAQRFSKPNRLV